MDNGEASSDEQLSFEQLSARENLDDLDIDQALDWIAQLVDAAGDHASEVGLRKALAWADELESRSPDDAAIINYFRANAWAHLEMLKHRADGDAARWSWDQPEAEQQILLLRAALNSTGFSRLQLGRKCQILTNLAGQLNTAGRPVEALEAWGKVLSMAPKFWMARGNRGIALMHYALSLYDTGHRGVFLLFAHRDLEVASRFDSTTLQWGDPAALQYFREHKRMIERETNLEAIEEHFEPVGYALGRSSVERAYRTWCLQERLFLNPLSDLDTHTIAAQDVLTLPDFVTSIGEPPVLTGFFNQMKQEFVSARWEYYLGVTAQHPHFSDRDVLLYNTLDYPAYGLAVERVKGAYKYAYSLFDKIAFFLNAYLALEIKPTSVSFRSIWREKNGDPIHPIRETFRQSENWPLRGLFWLSKDLFDERQKVATAPDARALHELRIHLEHRYVKVHEMMLESNPAGGEPDMFFDALAYRISRQSLEERTLRLLKLVRAALIYLSLAMHREEQRRSKARGESLTMPMALDPLRDRWKR